MVHLHAHILCIHFFTVKKQKKERKGPQASNLETIAVPITDPTILLADLCRTHQMFDP